MPSLIVNRCRPKGLESVGRSNSGLLRPQAGQRSPDDPEPDSHETLDHSFPRRHTRQPPAQDPREPGRSQVRGDLLSCPLAAMRGSRSFTAQTAASS
jgi:hypothetical protein